MIAPLAQEIYDLAKGQGVCDLVRCRLKEIQSIRKVALIVIIPESISDFFKPEDFNTYPLIRVPQQFSDSRGSIVNIADGRLGDVAVIESNLNAIRANHVHKDDWHLSYLVEGEIKYYWEVDDRQDSIVIQPGQLFYTPPQVPHKMLFLKKSLFIAVAGLSRTQDNYESDTIRLDEKYFE
jgi:uncharacterized RmlC-like cupin family protein